MKVDKLCEQLKQGKVASLYVILGTESYFINEAKNALLNVIPKEDFDVNVGTYDMETTPLTVALDDAMTIPFFGDRRLIFIKQPFFLTGDSKKRNIEHNLDELLGYLKQPQPSTTLVFIAPYEKLDERKKVTKLLKKNAEVIEAGPINENEVRRYLGGIFNKNKIVIENEALDMLLMRTNGNLTKAMNEAIKLTLFAQDTKNIATEDVKALVFRSLEENVFDLTDLVLQKKFSNAVMMYHDFIERKEEPVKLNAILSKQFRLLIQVVTLSNQGYAQGNIASVLKIHPYRIKIALQSIKRYQLKIKDLKKAFNSLVSIEKKLKSTTRSPEEMFQLFMLSFMQ
ncbi:DNA polymerase III subunit delta [Ligilactobacillus sp. WILCCON 0076]|uniref:DNA polymerase III subunit delta n=1 Tax=Ligilactobacillus ubinensis TaxID=2876789 RepID=A0A9X2JKU3_9LACO|nr:DNA polymerase III subunit delta [Ligilactobacillus ubinensis]MCP0886452.1 DNA polymerase III subunit delta [Ligilactobacillus ubinensis]